MSQEYVRKMLVIATDQHRGRLHKCPICGACRWSVWGHARKHWEKCSKTKSTEKVTSSASVEY